MSRRVFFAPCIGGTPSSLKMLLSLYVFKCSNKCWRNLQGASGLPETIPCLYNNNNNTIGIQLPALQQLETFSYQTFTSPLTEML